MSPTRRAVLLASTGVLTAAAGCSVLSAPEQSLLVAVNNYTDAPQSGRLRIDHDETAIVRQYFEVPAAEPDGWATVETTVALGELPSGTELDMTAAFGDGLRTTGSITLDCQDEYTGDAIYVQLDAEGDLRLIEVCYDQFPSGEATQGGINGS